MKDIEAAKESNDKTIYQTLNKLPNFEEHLKQINSDINKAERDRERLSESFLDYGNTLKVNFDTDGEEVEYSFEYSSDNERMSEKILESLYHISSITPKQDEPNIWRLAINDAVFIDVDKNTGAVDNINYLTAFEVRMLAQGKENRVPFSRERLTDFTPKTDLHTHLAGELTPDSLIEIGLKHDIDYPIELAKMAGIDPNNYEVSDKNGIKISSITNEDITKLRNALMIPQYTQETFNKMEKVYDLREPFTKSKELFPDCLMEVAKNYQKRGVEYAELSFSRFLKDSDYMELLDNTIPTIESTTGVKLRFVASLNRQAEYEKNMDLTDSLINIARQSPYIVGCDFMGQEVNSTDDFSDELKAIANYAMNEDPNFTIRVHAGENPIFRDNVKRTIEIINEAHDNLEKTSGTPKPMPRIRIGHGVYGVDDETLKLLKDTNTIVEFNMSSNLALNNINSLSEIPIKKYIDSGVSVVLGTDGGGLYSTTGSQEVILATAAGLESGDFAKIKETEASVMENQRIRERKMESMVGASHNYRPTYSTPDNTPRYKEEIARSYQTRMIEAEAAITDRLKKLNIETDPVKIELATRGKTPILITGASKGNWDNISPEDQQNISLTMQVLADVLNKDTAYIVTGGTDFGVEKEMHSAANRRRASGDDLTVVGTLTLETAREQDQGVSPNTITHAILLESGQQKMKSWLDMPEILPNFIKERDGCMIAVGGGSVVSNMIQRGHNLGINMSLMDGPTGASTNKSRTLSSNGYSFKNVEELIKKLYREKPQIFDKKFSLDQLNDYISKAADAIK
ncbi:hypothetical protein IKF12_02575 [Candidatus Saccharibacteria bacterium]|nr:hypothetical protein [Candidatus Saccharibacteria bacterium]